MATISDALVQSCAVVLCHARVFVVVAAAAGCRHRCCRGRGRRHRRRRRCRRKPGTAVFISSQSCRAPRDLGHSCVRADGVCAGGGERASARARGVRAGVERVRRMTHRSMASKANKYDHSLCFTTSSFTSVVELRELELFLRVAHVCFFHFFFLTESMKMACCTCDESFREIQNVRHLLTTKLLDKWFP